MRAGRATALLLGAIVLSLGAVTAALVSQHVYNMQPCPWCVLQRLIFLAIAGAAILALLLHRLFATLMVALAACGAGAALWQHFVAAGSASCNLTLAERIVSALTLDERWPDIFMATASCADAKVDLIGVPYEFWSLLLFVLLAALAMMALIGQRART